MAQAGPIAVYGATGYTGRLVVRELRRRHADVVLSGRSAPRLQALAEELELEAPVRAAELDDRDALRHALGECAAVISCAGPFVRYGEPVLKAAVETGTHYVDTTGEQDYMKHVYERYDDAARAAEVAAIPAVGFDYVPGDLASRLAARDREPLRQVAVGYAVSGFRATRGTLHSALDAARRRRLEYRDGQWTVGGLFPPRAHFTFPEPIGRRAMVCFPSGEVLTVPRHTRTRTVSSWITAAAFAPPVPGAEQMVPLALPALALALRTPARALVDLAIDRLPEGPTGEQRRAARFTIVALAFGEDGSSGRVVLRGEDMYGLTAVTAVHSAQLLAGEAADRTGALAPAQAFDPVAFLNHLADHGVSFELDGVVEEAAV
jgi:short subunit dehydrogenase-like uncharacterized protein